MMNRILEIVSKKFIKYGISEEYLEIYLFGIQSFMMHVLHISTMLMLGLLLQRLVETIVFVAVYAAMRTVAGGQHFKSARICFMMSCCLVLMILLPLNYIPISILVKYTSVFYLFGVIAIGCFSPCDSINKPMNNAEKKMYKIKTFYIVVLLSAFALICSQENRILEYIITVSLFVEGIGIIWGTIQNKYRCKVEEV